MKKVLLISAISFIYGTTSFAATPVAEQMAEILTTAYGADVKVEANEEKCSVTYPAATVRENATDSSQPALFGLGASASNKNSEYTIPATVAECEKIEDFKSYAQYKVSINSLNKFTAQIYNNFSDTKDLSVGSYEVFDNPYLAFVKDLTSGSYKEEIKVVPEIGVISYSKLHIDDLSYVKKDETTGLKSEIGNLAVLDSQQQVSEENNLIKYSSDVSMDSLNLAFPIFSLHIKGEKHRSEVSYEVPEDAAFDYQQSVEDIPFLSAIKYSALADDVKIGADMFGFNLGFDVDIKNTIQRENKESYYILGQTVFSSIKINGGFLASFINTNIEPEQISLKYSLKNIAVADVVALSKIPAQDEDLTNEEQKKIDEQTAELVDEIAKKTKLAANAEIKFADADIGGIWELEYKNGYLSGTGKIKVRNLFNIFPEQKQCVNNPQADKIPDCNNAVLSELKNVIDITQNDSETVYKYTEQGVFKDNVRIADPIKLDFKKMYLEQQKNDEEDQDITANPQDDDLQDDDLQDDDLQDDDLQP